MNKSYQWSYDINAFKTGAYCIIACLGAKGTLVMRSRWLADEQRWEFTSKDKNTILAAMSWPEFP